VDDGFIISGTEGLERAMDLTQCACEPIHIPGAIQPQGALVALLAQSGKISHASANLAQIVGHAAASVLGRQFSDLFDTAAIRALQRAEEGEASAAQRQHLVRGPDGRSLHLRAHRSGCSIVVDIEPLDMRPGHAPPVVLVQSVLDTFKHATSYNELCGLAVDGLKAITGYDRVMAYRFGVDGHGEVVAEAIEPGLNSYLGLTYPASDIPAQARRQFVRQRVGAVADAAYTPVPLLAHPSLDDGAPLDLTHSTLRSVSPVHREYMRNMGTVASLTIGLVHRNELWGMLMCHHGSPRTADPNVRAAADMIGQIVSLLLGNLGATQDYGQRLERSASLRMLVNCLSDVAPIEETLLAAQGALLHLVGAEGALLRFGGVSRCIGRTPPPEAAERAAVRLLTEAGGVMLAVRDAGVQHPDLADCIHDGSGVLVLPLDRGADAVGNAILWFRPEERSTILWAGSPHDHAIFDTESGRLSPRTSFSAWEETIRGRAAPWSEMDLAFARELQGMIENKVLQRSKAATEALAVRAHQLEEANAKLEELTRRLADARDEAEQAVQSKSRFLAGMSHALRTPLNGILGYAQLLRLEGRLDTTQTQRVNSMLDAGQQLLEMINRVLELTEVEAAHTKLSLTTVDIHELAITCLSVVRYAAEAKGLKLRISQAAGPVSTGTPVMVTADPSRLRQVLLNLLDNAIKFTDSGWVELRLCSADCDRLRIEIADTGPGLPTDTHGQVFEEFRRLNAASSLIAGAGVGLAITARLLMLMGGDLGYEDRSGGGSVFWLHLPIAAAGDDDRAVPAPPEPVLPSRLRLLVVDDIDMNRDIASAFLSAGGHEVTCAETGEEAVALAAETDFDVVLMDVCMPGMDGLEATRRIRALGSGRAQVPIVALTAQVFEEQINECRSAGMNSHLAKPFAYDTLLDAVSRAAQA
jgi:light-regulated signal transduction histidine kinase (bacteriophytochrome)/ActR/RegA family two-component response regulator